VIPLHGRANPGQGTRKGHPYYTRATGTKRSIVGASLAGALLVDTLQPCALYHYFGHVIKPDALSERYKLYRMYKCKDIFDKFGKGLGAGGWL